LKNATRQRTGSVSPTPGPSNRGCIIHSIGLSAPSNPTSACRARESGSSPGDPGDSRPRVPRLLLRLWLPGPLPRAVTTSGPRRPTLHLRCCGSSAEDQLSHCTSKICPSRCCFALPRWGTAAASASPRRGARQPEEAKPGYCSPLRGDCRKHAESKEIMARDEDGWPPPVRAAADAAISPLRSGSQRATPDGLTSPSGGLTLFSVPESLRRGLCNTLINRPFAPQRPC
jgi:hypothetical protein